MQMYLQPTPFLNSRHPVIVKKAHELCGHLSASSEKARVLYHEVRDGCHYNMYRTSFNPDDYLASSILAQGEGFCLQKAILLSALARSAGIPARLCICAIRNHKAPPAAVRIMGDNVFFPHAYNQLYIDDRWVSAAATFDRSICERINVPVVNFDGSESVLLPAADLNGQPFIEYVEHYGSFADVPWQWIMETMPVYYGHDFQRHWRQHLT